MAVKYSHRLTGLLRIHPATPFSFSLAMEPMEINIKTRMPIWEASPRKVAKASWGDGSGIAISISAK